jgi:hypothetical protein
MTDETSQQFLNSGTSMFRCEKRVIAAWRMIVIGWNPFVSSADRAVANPWPLGC